MGFDPVERTLLDVLVDHGLDAWLDTEQASERVLARLRDSGESFTLFTTAPWFGLSEPARHLEMLGLIAVDPGVAEFVPPGRPTPTAKCLFLAVTDKGIRTTRPEDSSEAQQQ